MERGIFVPMMIPAFPDNPCAGGGTVTSVGITAPAMFAVANSPITTSGTIALTLTTQQKSHVLIGPVANPPAAPTFRNLVADDIATGSAGPTHVLRGNMTWGNETVTSVNTQTGAVNLTAANVGAAATVHTHAASDIISGVIATARLASTGVASATTFLRGDQSWSAAPVTSVNTQTGAVNLTAANVGAAATVHTHAASDIVSGVIATARLASTGVASATTFLRGDQSWAAAPVTSVNTQTGAVNLTAADVGAAATVHTHAASDIVSGVIDTARLASTGTASATTFLRGDQSWATPPGLTGFIASQNTAVPNNLVNASQLLVDAATTNADIVITPKGLGAISAHLADNTITGGNKRGLKSVDLQISRNAATQVASGLESAILGGIQNTASGQRATVVGGFGNTAAGTGCVIGGSSNNATNAGDNQILFGQQNTASGADSVCIGRANNASNQESICLGSSNIASGVKSLSLGESCQATARNSVTLGGYNNRATAILATASGRDTISNSYNMRGYGAYPFTGTTGGQQYNEMLLCARTDTAANSRFMTADDQQIGAADAEFKVPADSVVYFDIMVTARVVTSDDNAAFRITGVIKQNAGVTAFAGAPTTTTILNQNGYFSVTPVAAAGLLRIQVTPLILGSNIHWLAIVKALVLNA